MNNIIRRVYFRDDFNFKLDLELDKSYSYNIKVSSIGINCYIASCYYEDDEWVCENCIVQDDELEIILENHHLPAGRILCDVIISDENDNIIRTKQIDTNIILTLAQTYLPDTLPESLVDLEQSLDIVKLKENIQLFRDKYGKIEDYLDIFKNEIEATLKSHHKILDKNSYEIDVLKKILKAVDEDEEIIDLNILNREVENLELAVTELNNILSSKVMVIPILNQNSDELYSFGGSGTNFGFSNDDYNLLQLAYEEGSSVILKAADATVNVLYMRRDTQLELGYIVSKHGGTYYFEVIRYNHPERNNIFYLTQSTPIAAESKNEVVVIPVYNGTSSNLFAFDGGGTPAMATADYYNYIQQANTKNMTIVLKGSNSTAQVVYVDNSRTIGYICSVQGKAYFDVITYHHAETNIVFSRNTHVMLSDLDLSLYSKLYLLTIDTSKDVQLFEAENNNVVTAFFNGSIKNIGSIILRLFDGKYNTNILTCSEVIRIENSNNSVHLKFVKIDKEDSSKITVYNVVVTQNQGLTYTTDEYILPPKDFININDNDIEIGKEGGNVSINGILNCPGIEFDGGEIINVDNISFEGGNYYIQTGKAVLPDTEIGGNFICVGEAEFEHNIRCDLDITCSKLTANGGLNVNKKDISNIDYLVFYNGKTLGPDDVTNIKEKCASTPTFWQGTQSEYDEIQTKDSNTLYIIKDE